MQEYVSEDVKLLLQIHDELICEVKEEKAQRVAQEIKSVMENIYTLHVPLRVSVAIGKNWGDLK